jgi:hypothetical protein
VISVRKSVNMCIVIIIVKDDVIETIINVGSSVSVLLIRLL